MSERQYEIMGELGELMKQQKELFEALPGAIRIMQIWEDAYKDGMTCTPMLNGINNHRGLKPLYPHPYEKLGTITRAYLRRQDGVDYDITVEDFFSIVGETP